MSEVWGSNPSLVGIFAAIKNDLVTVPRIKLLHLPFESNLSYLKLFCVELFLKFWASI